MISGARLGDQAGGSIGKGLGSRRRRGRKALTYASIAEAVRENTVDSSWFQGVMGVATLYALFGDDIRVQFAPVSSDGFFNTITALALALFIIEIIIFSLVQPDYFQLPDVGKDCANVTPSKENSWWNVLQK